MKFFLNLKFFAGAPVLPEAPNQKGAVGSFFALEQATGIEPAASAWEAEVLPLDYACDLIILYQKSAFVNADLPKILVGAYISFDKFLMEVHYASCNINMYFPE